MALFRERHPVTCNPVFQIIHSFGWDNQLVRNESIRICQSNLLSFDVDLIFYDTTTASFHVNQEDGPDSRPQCQNYQPQTHGETYPGLVL